MQPTIAPSIGDPREHFRCKLDLPPPLPQVRCIGHAQHESRRSGYLLNQEHKECGEPSPPAPKF